MASVLLLLQVWLLLLQIRFLMLQIWFLMLQSRLQYFLVCIYLKRSSKWLIIGKNDQTLGNLQTGDSSIIDEFLKLRNSWCCYHFFYFLLREFFCGADCHFFPQKVHFFCIFNNLRNSETKEKWIKVWVRDWHIRSGLLRTPTSSTFWIFEALVRVPKVADEQESQDENKEFRNPGLRGRRRPAEACIRWGWRRYWYQG